MKKIKVANITRKMRKPTILVFLVLPVSRKTNQKVLLVIISNYIR
jgi:hypothetical protein